MNILVIGTNSRLGAALGKRLVSAGHKVTYTTRRKAPASSDTLFFDLSEPADSWPDWPKDIDVAFIAAAVTRQADCESDPDNARFINTSQTTKLIEQLLDRDIHVIFPSTNLVLACDQPKQPVDSPLSPIGIYGQTKAAIEKRFHKNDNVTIARLPKILQAESGLIAEWIENLKNGKPIIAFSNLIIEPVSLDYAIDFLARLIKAQPGGVWQISGEEEISYYDLGCALASQLNKSSENLVKKSLLENKNVPTPKHPGMDMSKAEKFLNLPCLNNKAHIKDILN